MPDLKNQAPNMFVDYPDNGSYDLVMVDWYCEVDGLNTYWAVQQISTDAVDAYGGFQNADGNHVLMFSVWDHGLNYPVVEYVSKKADLSNLNFDREGTGKHISTNYNWEVNKWYTMCIGTKTVSGKTYYAQWICETGKNNWLLTGVISYPIPSRVIGSCLMFQEDFEYNNVPRKCRLKNAFGKYNGATNWDRWNRYHIRNNFYKFTDTQTPQINFKYDCDKGTDSSATYVYIQSGGEDLSNPIERTMTLPVNLSIISGSQPSSFPSWASLAPRFIKSKYSNLYVNPGNGNSVVQKANIYYWNFVDSNDGYFYILNSDKTKAITISGTSDGSDLILTSFTGSDTQKWTNKSVRLSEYVYFFPKNAPNMNMDIEGPSAIEGTVVQIFGHADDPEQFKWLSLDECDIHSIKSLYSSMFVVPSGNKIVQSSTEYKWNFVSAGSGYFYITTLDNNKAITVSGTNDGSDLSFALFEPGNNNQKWKLSSIGGGQYYLIPKANENMNMDIEGPTSDEGAFIQLWTHADGVSQFKWRLM